jgi:hypothetical protein
VTDPEDTVSERPADIADEGVAVLDETEREIPVEADDADAVEQQQGVPDDGADDYDYS